MDVKANDLGKDQSRRSEAKADDPWVKADYLRFKADDLWVKAGDTGQSGLSRWLKADDLPGKSERSSMK